MRTWRIEIEHHPKATEKSINNLWEGLLQYIERGDIAIHEMGKIIPLDDYKIDKQNRYIEFKYLRDPNLMVRIGANGNPTDFITFKDYAEFSYEMLGAKGVLKEVK